MTKGVCSVLILALAACWPATGGIAQVQHVADQPVSAAEDTRPLPDIPTLMRDAEDKEKASEAIQKNYLYRSAVTQHELDSDGKVKKTETREYDVFWLDGFEITRLTKKNGKELSASERQKQSEELDKRLAKAKKQRDEAQQKGAKADPHDVSVSRILELGTFSNPRRVKLNGRDTIAVDYTGDPKAKTRNRFERVFLDLAGTVWVDEQDHALVKADGHFDKAYKVGGGLVINIQKGTSFSMIQTKVNNEVWLPEVFAGQGEARMLLLFDFKGNVQMVNSDYRKFRTTSTILPVMGVPAQQ